MNKFYLTTPIYYVNDIPHLGHTYTTVAADVLARFYQQRGYQTYFLTGTDEHGAKIVEAAKKHGSTPQEYVDKIAAEFQKTWEKLNIKFNRFIRTTDSDHIETVQKFLNMLYEKGAIDPQPRLYQGLYCIGCEKFLSPSDLKNGLCPDHLTPPIQHSEENYYFNLSKYRETLIQLIFTDQIKILPETRKNEILGKLKLGLEDISISRANLEWGVPLPFNPKHTAYVWIDALINYYTYGHQQNIWPADLHLVGKDILWFHAVIWPALLLAADLETPKKIFAHGYFTVNGQKMSKTIGNVIKPDDLIQKYGVDGARYVILAAFPFGEDGDISWELFDRLYTADLSNGLGNLVSRIAKLAEKARLSFNHQLSEQNQADSNYIKKMQELNFSEALQIINQHLRQLDIRINQDKPWEIQDEERLRELLSDYIYHLLQTINLLAPFIPDTAQKIKEIFRGQVKAAPVLFPRILNPNL